MESTILSSLSQDQLWDNFVNSRYPKWSSLCLLKYLGYRVLDSTVIYPEATRSQTQRAIHNFATRLRLQKILLRTDGGRESGPYPRGGNSVEKYHALELVLKFQQSRRAVILMQPTNRFTNKLSMNLHLNSSGSFHIDILGEGFDVSDLNRGLITPEISISVLYVDWTHYDYPSWFFTKCFNTPVRCIRHQRLLRIGDELLPAMGIEPIGTPEKFAENWLRSNDFTGLFQESRPVYDFRLVCKFYEVAFILGSVYRQKTAWDNLVISLTDFGDGLGFNFWDISNPKEKFYAALR
jgi:hypothetical protein